MRVSDVFTARSTPGNTANPDDGYYSGDTRRRNFYYDYYEGGGFDNNNFNGFERGPTRRSFLGILG